MFKSSAIMRVLRAPENAQFRLYLVGNMPSVIGTWVQKVAIGWLTWELTQSGAWLGLIAFADFAPIVVFSPLAGVIADRLDRLTVARLSVALSTVLALALAGLTASGRITIEALFALVLVQGVVQALYQPVRQAIVANTAARADLAAAISLNAALWHSARFIGPALAGVIIVAWGIWPAFAVNAVSYLSFAVALIYLRLPRRSVARRPLSAVPRDIADGWRYVIGHPGIGPILMIVAITSVAGRPVAELLPGFAAVVFERGAVGLAWLTSASGIGAVLGAMWLAQRGRLGGLTRILVWNVLMVALTLALFAATDNFWIGTLGIAAVGFALVVSGTATQTLVQWSVDESMQGRVLSIYGLLWLGGPALGTLAMGGLSELFGLRAPVLGGAVICVAVWAWAAPRTKRLQRALEADPRAP
jgi:MFS family permease